MILINRRGYSNYIICNECGNVIKCPNCDISLTYHKKSDTLRCHYCGYGTNKPETCPKCKSKYLVLKGIGTEKIEELLYDKFKNIKVVRMDRDTTSNKGSHDFQLTEDANGERLFEKVLKKSQEWANDEQMMYVVGATQGRAFEDIRKIVPNHFLLVPGIGAQGGSLEEVCKYGMNSTCGLIVNSSRGIIYVDKTENFAAAARAAAKEVQEQMAEQLKAIL